VIPFLQADAPVLVRAWTALTGPETQIVGVRGDRIVYRAAWSLGVIRSKDGSKVWRIENPDRFQGPNALGKTSILAVRDADPKISLVKIDLETGTAGQRITLPGQVRDIAVEGGLVYLLLATGSLRAYSEADFKPQWAIPFPEARNPGKLWVAGTHLLAGVEGAVYSIARTTGKVEWVHNESMYVRSLLDGKVVLDGF